MKIRQFMFFVTAVLAIAACERNEEVATPAASSSPPTLERSPAPAGARVFFINPADGSTVTSPVSVEFGAEGMVVVPSGDMTTNSGHHHILIDTGLPDLGLPVPKDEKHVHLGDGSSTVVLDLAPGEHSLQLLFADHLHIPHEPPVYSERITITVE